MKLEGVMIQDRENLSTVFTLHGDCAERVIEKVNTEYGYERMFVYGPGTLESCAATDCPHTHNTEG